MRCTVCAGDLAATRTDLPFKVTETAIAILKNLPVLACERCPEYLIEDDVLGRVDQILARLDDSTELTIIRYADGELTSPRGRGIQTHGSGEGTRRCR